ncbi:predicted protein [Arabidopsis lyrata subsp. lyrata]|uniref:Predicted protein n=1 Tax=Arabidopsis lyrata subsp. lyrata TaxID=81972 RepID=D7LSR3_ARALL|nr:predicted protein [Arabidopsis lyrata subsp. lyrata]
MAVIVATTTAEALPPDQPEPPDRLLSVGSPVLLFSTGSGLSSPASLPLLLARSFITVGAQFPGGSPFADWVGDLEARPCPTMAMTTSFRVACFFSDTSTSPPITFSQAVLFGAEVRMTILSHLVSTSLTIKVGLLLDSVLTLLDHLIGDSFLPCIEVSVRLALIWYVTKGFVPIFCIGISVFADVIWEVQSLFRAMLPHLGIHCLFVFPKVPLVWSGLDDQASPVLQGPSSRLASSALVAELVTLRVALDAVSYEVFGIVLFRSHWTSFVKLYLAFISSLSSFEVFLGTSCLVILYSPFIWVVIPPPLSEFET